VGRGGGGGFPRRTAAQEIGIGDEPPKPAAVQPAGRRPMSVVLQRARHDLGMQAEDVFAAAETCGFDHLLDTPA